MKSTFFKVLLFATFFTARSLSAAVFGDINNDGKVDMREAIYALQVSSGMYSELSDSCLLFGRGAWSDGEAYNACDVVERGGLTYACLQSHTASAGIYEPPDPVHWTLLTTTGPQGPKGDKGDIGATGPAGLPGTTIWAEGASQVTTAANVGIGTTNPARRLHLADAMRLEPISDAPSSQAPGDLYYDNSDALCVYMTAGWVKLAGSGYCGSMPLSNSGQDQSGPVGAVVTLNGIGSEDPDGDTITYSWVITEAPTGSSAALSDPSIANPDFVPDLPGVYIISLVVNDGHEDSQPDSVTITVNSPSMLTIPSDLPFGNRVVQAFVYQSRLYAVIGNNTFPYYTVYSTDGSGWNVETSDPGTTLNDHASTVLNIGGDIYFIRISDPVFVWKYSIDNHVWDTSLTPIPSARSWGFPIGGGAVVHDGAIYIFGGGVDLMNISSNVDKFDPSVGPGGTWTSLNNHSVLNGSRPVSVGDFIYLVGGSSCSDPGNCTQSSCDKYDPANDTYLPMTPFPKNISGWEAGGVAVGNDIYILGGKHSRWEAGTAEVYKYSISGDTWTQINNMQKDNYEFTAFLFDSKIYCMGGNMATTGVTPVWITEIEEYLPQ